jgi:hypothetical protein
MQFASPKSGISYRIISGYGDSPPKVCMQPDKKPPSLYEKEVTPKE